MTISPTPRSLAALPTTTGNNVGATLQPTETNVIATADNGLVNVGESVWFEWTAPVSGNINFSTAGRRRQSEPMNTVLTAWMGTNSSLVTFTTLALVGADDDVSAGNVNSSLTFYAWLAPLTMWASI